MKSMKFSTKVPSYDLSEHEERILENCQGIRNNQDPRRQRRWAPASIIVPTYMPKS